MVNYYKGSLTTSPLVTSFSGSTYGTHHSTLGIGGYVEVMTIQDRNNIPIDSEIGLEYDGLSSGRRRLGMLVKVLEENKIYELYVEYSTWITLTNEDKLAALSNNSSWVLLSIGGGTSNGEYIGKIFYQANHGFEIGNVINWDSDSSIFEKGLAITGNSETIGVVSEIIDSNNFEVVFNGYYELTGSTVVSGGLIQENSTYFLSSTESGLLTLEQPTNVGDLSKPLLVTMGSNGNGGIMSIILHYRSGIIQYPIDGIISGGTSTQSISSENVSKKYTITNHGFSVKDVLSLNNGVFIKAIADGSMDLEIIGVVTKVINLNEFVLTYSGFVSEIVGLLNNTTYYLSPLISGALTINKPNQIGELEKPILITKDNNEAIILSYKPELIQSISGGTSNIGDAEDGDYTDGYFTDITPTMRAGIPIDRFNELFKLLLPPPAPQLTDIISNSTFIVGKLSFGSSRNDIGYVNVSDVAGNSIVDINGLYAPSGTRLGIINDNVSGIINDSIIGDPSGIPFENYAFNNADQGILSLELNGVSVNEIILSGTTGSINNISNNTTITLSELKNVKLENGNPVEGNYYRLGTYSINKAAMANGFNYIKITHTVNALTIETNYLEWVYDSESNNITFNNLFFDEISLSGIKYVSGVKFYTSGYVKVKSIVSNIYKNIYYDGNAVSYPTKINLGNPTSTVISGTTVNTSNNLSLPSLRTDVPNPQNGVVDIISVLPISSLSVLGNVGDSGTLSTNVRVLHPFNSKSSTSNSQTETGFLIYNENQTNNLENEDFIGEINRLQDRDYKSATYSDINNGNYNWNSTNSLIGLDILYNTGLLVFNGELIYPNSIYLTSEYGIVSGNFNGVIHTPSSNVDYSTASGIRNHFRKFKSNNPTTQSTLTFEITHNGDGNSFLVDDGESGVPFNNIIKFEFLIVRANNSIIGWANPFSIDGSAQLGIANTNISHSNGITTVSCTLSTNRVAFNDLILTKIKASSAWSNKITNITITNI